MNIHVSAKMPCDRSFVRVGFGSRNVLEVLLFCQRERQMHLYSGVSFLRNNEKTLVELWKGQRFIAFCIGERLLEELLLSQYKGLRSGSLSSIYLNQHDYIRSYPKRNKPYV